MEKKSLEQDFEKKRQHKTCLKILWKKVLPMATPIPPVALHMQTNFIQNGWILYIFKYIIHVHKWHKEF